MDTIIVGNRVFIVLLGPPGVGKGTHAKILAGKTGLTHISSGDMFRENLKNQTELGKLAQTFMGRGELVPDDVTIAMIKDRLGQPDCDRGAILDGFPRTPEQADALEVMLTDLGGKVDVALLINADFEALVERLSGRWTCTANGHVTNTLLGYRIGDRCELDDSEMVQREDDKPETAVKRLDIYRLSTAPLIKYYRERLKLLVINGLQEIEKVTADILTALQPVLAQ